MKDWSKATDDELDEAVEDGDYAAMAFAGYRQAIELSEARARIVTLEADLAEATKGGDAYRLAMLRAQNEVLQLRADLARVMGERDELRAMYKCVYCTETQTESAAARRDLEVAVRLLRELEWSARGGQGEWICPECGSFEHLRKGHAGGCALGLLLATHPAPEPTKGPR